MKKTKLTYSENVKKWVKALHIYLASIWGGGAASLFAIHCLFTPDSGPELYARNMALISVDNYVIIPSATGCFLTGITLSYLTQWGYLKFYWIIVKLSFNAILIFAGFFWLIPWLDKMAEASSSFRHMMMIEPSSAAAMDVHMIMAVGQTTLMLFLVIISVFKPWGKTGMKG